MPVKGVESVPARPMSGKVVLITGASDGIGKQAALGLARQGATVVGVGRNARKCEEVADELRAESSNPDVNFLIADLSSVAEVRRLASDFRERCSRLDVLMNNAGALYWNYGTSVDGHERTFALNHLSHWVLTTDLLDMLRASAPSRIVNVSSGAHYRATSLDGVPRAGYTLRQAFDVYAETKLANVLFSNELARRLEGTGVVSNALHPGFVRTRFARSGPWYLNYGTWLAQRLYGISGEEGAQTPIYVASSSELNGTTGMYFTRSRTVTPNPAAQNVEAARRLWELSERLAAAVPA